MKFVVRRVKVIVERIDREGVGGGRASLERQTDDARVRGGSCRASTSLVVCCEWGCVYTVYIMP